MRQDLVKNGIQPVDGLRLQTATGESAVIKGKKTVHIRIGNGQFKHEVLVANIMDEVIVGMDFMKITGLCWTFNKGFYATVTLNYRCGCVKNLQ